MNQSTQIERINIPGRRTQLLLDQAHRLVIIVILIGFFSFAVVVVRHVFWAAGNKGHCRYRGQREQQAEMSGWFRFHGDVMCYAFSLWMANATTGD